MREHYCEATFEVFAKEVLAEPPAPSAKEEEDVALDLRYVQATEEGSLIVSANEHLLFGILGADIY